MLAGDEVKVYLPPYSLVADLKQKISEQTGIEIKELRLKYNAKILENEETLAFN